MRPRQFAAMGALGGTIALAGWGAANLSGFDAFDIENAVTTIGDRGATRGAMALSADAKTVDTPMATAATNAAMSYLELPEPVVALAAVADVPLGDPARPESAVGTAAVSATDAATVVPDPPGPAFVVASASATEVPLVQRALPDSGPTHPPKTGVSLASLFAPDPTKEYPKPAVRPLDTLDECLVPEICIDEYLWSLYERAPKVDTNKVIEHIKVTVKKKGKTRTVKKAITKYVLGDFTWKDPIAAQRAGMSLKDYVIGGMDRGFKLKLYRAVRKMEDAGLMPGITSAFRDDYRQSIAVGNTAASDSSYHGGSRRGGYGRGLAADLVSVKGETRMQRYASSDELWKWIDAHEKELEIGRPYRDRDPPHVGPIDGKEYADKRGRANVQKAGLPTKNAQAARSKTKKRLAARNDPGATKRAKPATSSKTATLKTGVSAQR